ncbi:MAG TPA: TonB-dependent receptor, partial [Bacteroidales bacterium]|nr:TonB-dependent receptor [Bacteroidales bacterium]
MLRSIKESLSNPTMKNLFIFLIQTTFIFFTFSASAESLTKVSITVSDQTQNSLPGATVQLQGVTNARSFAAITNFDGVATFEGVIAGSYRMEIRFIGMTTLEQQIEIAPDRNQFAFALTENAQALGEVTITARRPIIRQEGDRVIIDPEPLTGISTNTLEVLEMTPGLFVDPEGGIFLNSATPAAIYINGRLQRMSQQDINNILRSLPPGSVQRIELIRTPSTRFDAATSGGIINIVLRQGIRLGRFGSVSAGFNQGESGNRFASFSLNNSNERLTSFINAGVNFNGVTEDLNSTRFMPLDAQLSQNSINRQGNYSGNLGLGITYEFNPNARFTYDGRFNAGFGSSDATNINFLGIGSNPVSISENLNLLNNERDFLMLQQDLGFNLKLDTLGSEWDTKLGYGFGNNFSEQNFTNNFIFPVQPSFFGNGENRFLRNSFLFQTDLTYHLNDIIVLETGLKSTLVDFSSNTEFFNTINNNSIPDLRRTNAFTYNERINALYAQATFNLPAELVLKTGFRLENTRMEGNQTIPNDTSFVLNRTDFFPYAFLSRRLFAVGGFELRGFLIYRRTIGRPDYS